MGTAWPERRTTANQWHQVCTLGHMDLSSAGPPVDQTGLSGPRPTRSNNCIIYYNQDLSTSDATSTYWGGNSHSSPACIRHPMVNYWTVNFCFPENDKRQELVGGAGLGGQHGGSVSADVFNSWAHRVQQVHFLVCYLEVSVTENVIHSLVFVCKQRLHRGRWTSDPSPDRLRLPVRQLFYYILTNKVYKSTPFCWKMKLWKNEFPFHLSQQHSFQSLSMCEKIFCFSNIFIRS